MPRPAPTGAGVPPLAIAEMKGPPTARPAPPNAGPAPRAPVQAVHAEPEVSDEGEEDPENPGHPSPPTEPAGDPAAHPLVKEAIELFNARIVDVQPKRD